MITVTVCVGSSCHIKGARELIECFNELLVKAGLEDKVELKGAFCMERCGEGVNWMIDDEVITSTSIEHGARKFREKVIKTLAAGETAKPAKPTAARKNRRRKKT